MGPFAELPAEVLAIRGFKQATADVFHPHIVPKSLAKLTFVNRLGHADKLTEHWYSALWKADPALAGTLPCRNGKALALCLVEMARRRRSLLCQCICFALLIYLIVVQRLLLI